MQDTPKANPGTRSAANWLLASICDFSYNKFWCMIVEEGNSLQQYREASKMTLHKRLMKLNTLNEWTLALINEEEGQ